MTLRNCSTGAACSAILLFAACAPNNVSFFAHDNPLSARTQSNQGSPPSAVRTTGTPPSASTPARQAIPEKKTTSHVPESPPWPDGILSLKRARALALASNPEIHAAVARLAGAAARLDEARGRYVPTVEFAHGSFRAFQIPGSLEGVAGLVAPGSSGGLGGMLGLSSLFNAFRGGAIEPFSEHATSLSASWVLFDGFLREAALEAARQLEKAAAYSYHDVQRLLLRTVDATYFQIQFAVERLRIAAAAQSFAEEQLAATQKLHAAGRASVADIQNFRVRMLTARTEVTASEGMRDAARIVLAELLALDEVRLPSDWNVEDLSAETPEDLAPPDLDASMAAAVEHRPDVRQLEHMVRGDEAAVRAAKAAYWPTVAVGGSWGFDRTSNLKYSEDDQASAGGIAFRWALVSGGRRPRIRQAESALLETSAKLNRLRLGVVSEVRRAVIQVTDAQEQIALHREAVAAATENRRVVQAAYLAGKESLTRLNETQRDFTTAEANLAVARIRLRQAWSELEAVAPRPLREPATTSEASAPP